MSADDLGMRRSTENRLGDADAVHGQRPGKPARTPRPRTVNIIFGGVQSDGSCTWTVTGGQIINNGMGLPNGTLHGGRERIFALVSRLRDAWTTGFVLLQAGEDAQRKQYRFGDSYDLSAHRGTPVWENALRELARTGYEIYRAIFLTGDEELRAAGAELSNLLRSGQQVITIQSDELFVPWHMLYVPTAGEDMLDPDCAWEFEGFLGFQHHIEQTFRRRPRSFHHRLPTAGGIQAGLNVDSHLDSLRSPVVQPLREFLKSLHADKIRTRFRETLPELARELSAADFNDQVIYFNCHGTVAAAGFGEAHIALTDGRRIYTSNFQSWLTGRQFTHSPIVFVNACEGGQLSSMYLESFGRTLLDIGANCLVGPQIDIPADFARQYALEFFRELLRGVSIGDVVKGLARGFAERHGNPLGLIMSLYRGLDTYFDVQNGDDPAPATQRILLVPDDPVEQSWAPA